jgi:transposase-like protein
MKEFKTLAEFITTFKNEEVCRAYFAALRFKDGEYCPFCKHDRILHFADGKRYRCNFCKKDFTIKTRTLFGESKIPLQKWFIAIYLLTTNKKGISSINLANQVGVTQKTAWYMDMRIREALKQGKFTLEGDVEVDETYIGGRHKRKDGFSKKEAIMGMTERGGKIKAYHIPNRQAEHVLTKIMTNIRDDAHLMTDEARVYKRLNRMGYKHGFVKHGKKHWAHGKVNTNSIESFWALFKRNYHGTYHSMSKKHLQRYIDEVCFRFNNREFTMQEAFDEVIQRVSKHGKISYEALTA